MNQKRLFDVNTNTAAGPISIKKIYGDSDIYFDDNTTQINSSYRGIGAKTAKSARSGYLSRTRMQPFSDRLQGSVSATAKSRVMPKTNIPVIDQYYRSYDTQG